MLIDGRQRRSGSGGPPLSVSAAVGRFALVSVAAILLLGAVGVAIMRSTGTAESIREAKQVTRLVGRGTVEPAVTPGVLSGDPRAIRKLDRLGHSPGAPAPSLPRKSAAPGRPNPHVHTPH